MSSMRARGLPALHCVATKIRFWPMVIYGVSLWGVGLIGGYWIAFYDTPLGSPRGALGFWEAATVALGMAAIALTWLTNAVSHKAARA